MRNSLDRFEVKNNSFFENSLIRKHADPERIVVTPNNNDTAMDIKSSAGEKQTSTNKTKIESIIDHLDSKSSNITR